MEAWTALQMWGSTLAEVSNQKVKHECRQVLYADSNKSLALFLLTRGVTDGLLKYSVSEGI